MKITDFRSRSVLRGKEPPHLVGLDTNGTHSFLLLQSAVQATTFVRNVSDVWAAGNIALYCMMFGKCRRSLRSKFSRLKKIEMTH